MKCPACDSENKDPYQYKYSPATIDKLALFDERKILCCKNCGFGMIEEDVDEELLQKYYLSDYSGKARKQAETDILDIRTGYSFDMRAVSQIALIKQYVALGEEQTVIEIGAGAGTFLFLLRQMGFKGRYVAFEPQQQAQEYINKLNGEAEGKGFDLKSAEKYKGQADLVVMSHSLEHFNPGKISEIICGVNLMLRQQGGFFCEVPNANLNLYPNAGERVVPHLSFFSINALKGFVEKAGMKTVFIKSCGDSQLNKDQEKRIVEGEKEGAYLFDLDYENGIFRNRRYHHFIEHDRRRKRKLNSIIRFAASLLGGRNVMRVIEFMRRCRQKPHHSLLMSSQFSYGADREFIRMIVLKNS